MRNRAIDRIVPIKNLPYSYPWYKRTFANIAYHIGRISFLPRSNHLTKRDIRKVRGLLKDGDIILSGNFQYMSGMLIDGAVTHAIGYIGAGRCVHAVAEGVTYISLNNVLRRYDTVIILRPYWKNPEQYAMYREFLLSQIGKPYDFFFGLETGVEDTFFCTKLINDGLTFAGYDTGLLSIQESKNLLDNIVNRFFRAHRILKPRKMVSGHFSVIYTSENLITRDDGYYIKGGKILQIVPDKLKGKILDRNERRRQKSV